MNKNTITALAVISLAVFAAVYATAHSKTKTIKTTQTVSNQFEVCLWPRRCSSVAVTIIGPCRPGVVCKSHA